MSKDNQLIHLLNKIKLEAKQTNNSNKTNWLYSNSTKVSKHTYENQSNSWDS